MNGHMCTPSCNVCTYIYGYYIVVIDNVCVRLTDGNQV